MSDEIETIRAIAADRDTAFIEVSDVRILLACIDGLKEAIDSLIAVGIRDIRDDLQAGLDAPPRPALEAQIGRLRAVARAAHHRDSGLPPDGMRVADYDRQTRRDLWHALDDLEEEDLK